MQKNIVIVISVLLALGILGGLIYLLTMSDVGAGAPAVPAGSSEGAGDFPEVSTPTQTENTTNTPTGPTTSTPTDPTTNTPTDPTTSTPTDPTTSTPTDPTTQPPTDPTTNTPTEPTTPKPTESILKPGPNQTPWG